MGESVRRMRKTATPLNPRPKPILSIKMVLPPTMIPISPQSLNKPIIGNWDLVSTTIFKSQPGITILVLVIFSVLQSQFNWSIFQSVWQYEEVGWRSMSSFPLFHFTHAFHPHHRYLATSHPDFPITSLSSGVCPPSFPHLRTCLPSLSPHFRHLLNSPNPTHSGVVDDHDSQAHLGHITTSSDSLPFKHV